MSPAPLPLTLTATATLGSDSMLTIHYELLNASEQPVYLFNRLTRLGAESVFDTDPNAVNVVLTSDRVVVGKAQVAVPPNQEVERPYVPGLSLVASGTTLAEVVRLPQPLVPFTWYQSRPMRSTPVLRPLYFELGYAPATPATTGFVELLNTPYGDLHYAGRFPLAQQQLLTTRVLLTAVPVLSER
ncbi:MAG: hypothetical protein ACRYFZ_09190 [Janthinobacterium lividum]